uniref:Uncharacterized protein n=2 Tax=Corethron hystrix TaxID=216773 RepID=A0A7S1B657_9STRA|mmetsp:Transcript_14552/g.32044  ORF Transcript_14552/g.32044 Transcript_14552/m.32044 type:complete len:211 (+) Transcript_14552:912-1544(+)
MAMSPYTFCVFVHKDSANRLIFEKSAELKHSIGTGKSQNKKGVQLKFLSHPNYGLTPNKEFPVMDLGPIKFMLLYIGPAEEAVTARFSDNQELVLDDYGGMVFRGADNTLDNHNLVNATLDSRPGQQFQVNDEGSISPVKAPHLVLGIPEVGYPDEEINKTKLEANKLAVESYGLLSDVKVCVTPETNDKGVHDIDDATELFHKMIFKNI